MKLILCHWNCLCETAILQTLTKLGCEVISYKKEIKDYDYDTEYLKSLLEFVKQYQKVDLIFSVNYLPIVARACKHLRIPYISWMVDCPLYSLYSETISYPTNYVFVLDKLQASRIEPFNPGHIFHLPLACDTDFYSTIQITNNDIKKYSHDIAFVGSLYSEKNIDKYDKFTKNLSDYQHGYIDALIDAQQEVWGCDIISEALTDSFCKEFIEKSEIQFNPDYNIDSKYFITQYILNYKCTELDRKNLLNIASQEFDTHLYTLSDSSMLPLVHNHGPADSTLEMPKIFKLSKINLNITLRSIQSGIPLRIFDILGCGGFLLTNYQPEIAELFEDGIDLVMFTDKYDFIKKIRYYMQHNDERNTIAQNGCKKVHALHNYEIRLAKMFKTITETIH